jgi:microcystin-dependent protein
MPGTTCKGLGLARVIGLLVATVVFAPRTASAQPFLGEIKWGAFNFAPKGWALCNGQVMLITQNPDLFQLIGTTYGGDGITTFALPDVQGRVLVGVGGSHGIGETGGAESLTLTIDQMPAHNHMLPAHHHVLTPHTHDLPQHAHDLPAHDHAIPSLAVDVKASSAAATTTAPAGNVLAAGIVKKVSDIYNAGPANVSLGASATTAAGTTGMSAPATTALNAPSTSAPNAAVNTGDAAPVVGTTGGGLPFDNKQPFLALTCIIALTGTFPGP